MIAHINDIAELEQIALRNPEESVGAANGTIGLVAGPDGTIAYEKSINFRTVTITRAAAVRELQSPAAIRRAAREQAYLAGA